jgi:UDP-N-acetylmuramoyl-tripeptide--D-alanyl-D-alanine ligase
MTKLKMKKLVKSLLQYEARLVLKKYKPKIIAITGSVGKTTTRDFLYCILSKKFFVRKSEKSIATGLGAMLTVIGRPNAEIAFALSQPFSFLVFLKIIKIFLLTLFFGLSLILWRQNYPDWLILEIDADKPGDVDSVSGWLTIDILVVTAVGSVPSHVEAFDSDLGKFLLEKKKLLNSVSRDGIIVYNNDDQTVCHLVSLSPLQKISCGLGGDSNVRGTEFEILMSNGGSSKPIGMKFEIIRPAGEVSGSSGSGLIESVIIMDSVGIHNEYATLLSFAVADLLNVSLSDCVKTIEKSPLLPGRMKIIAGLKDSTIIDDSYNSSPVAVRQAVEVFNKVSSVGRKIAVIGDMLELGKFSADEHREVGRLLVPIAQYVVCIGLRARRVAEAMLSLSYDEEKISCFDGADEVGDFLCNFIEPGDLILVKGSQAMRLEKVSEKIMRHPEDAKNLLVRQEPEWLSRD